MSLSIKFAVSSQEGKIKSAGVDAFLAEPELGLFAIATGEPRGAEKGAASSAEIFLSTLREHIGEVAEAVGRQQGAWGQLGKLFGHVFQKSSQAIHDAFAGRVPNTSATILLLRGDRGAVTHVGRTRAYAIRGGEVARLTEEHVDTDKDEYDADMTQLAVRPTGIGEQSLGQQKSVEVGGVLFKLKPGARFVLISQGIAGLVRGEALLQISRASTDVDGCAAAVVAAATERQMIADNTALVVHLGDGAKKEAAPEAAAQGPAPEAPAAQAPPAAAPEPPADPLLALFDGMSSAQRDLLERAGAETDLGGGGMLVKAGDRAARFYIVRTGLLEGASSDGVAAAFGPGSIVGEHAFLRGGTHQLTVTATSKSALLGYRLDRLEPLFASDPVMAARFYQNILRMLIAG